MTSKSSSVPLLRSFINGKYWTSSSSSSAIPTGCYDLSSAVTGQLRAKVEPASVEACNTALEAAHQSQPHWHRNHSPMERSQLLLRAADLLLQDEESKRIARLETEDTGRPLLETRFEAAGAADCLQWFAGLTRSFGGQYLEIPASRGGRSNTPQRGKCLTPSPSGGR